MLGRREAGVPPKAATFTGAVDDFASSGHVLVDALSEVAGLTPTSAVLDVGCGIGRFARAMAAYVDADGRYEGLDIVPAGIAWCTNNISSGYNNVHFTLADVRNGEYNPKGRQEAAEYTFPYPDDTFDLAVLISVFTHLLAAETDRYLSEIARVLKPGGRCFATLCLINPESIAGMATGDLSVCFKRPSAGPCWTVGARVPELAVAFEEEYIAATCARHGLAIHEPIYRGAWYGHPTRRWPSGSGLGGQDTIIATKHDRAGSIESNVGSAAHERDPAVAASQSFPEPLTLRSAVPHLPGIRAANGGFPGSSRDGGPSSRT